MRHRCLNVNVQKHQYFISNSKKVNDYCRGISSIVRRCIEKETGKEYAAKIIDLSSSDGANDCSNLDATKQEINILRHVAGHPYISKYFLLILMFSILIYFS